MTGVYVGVCTLTQSNILIFGCLAFIGIVWQHNRHALKKALRPFLCFFAGLSIVLGLVIFRNYWVEKDFVPVAGHLGLNFFTGNNAETTGLHYYPPYFTPTQEGIFRDARIIAEASSGRHLKTSEISHFWFLKSVEFIKSQPLKYLALLSRKFEHLWLDPREPLHDNEFAFLSKKIRIFKILFLNLRFILPFAYLGLIMNLKNLRKTALLYLVLATLSASIILFFVTSRYRSRLPLLCSRLKPDQ